MTTTTQPQSLEETPEKDQDSRMIENNDENDCNEEMECESDEENDEEYESDDDDDTIGASALWEDWKQHAVAVLVAVLAASIGYMSLGGGMVGETTEWTKRYPHESLLSAPSDSSSLSTPSHIMSSSWDTPPTERQHHVVHTYRRMSNVTFCDMPLDIDLREARHHLGYMDFVLSKDDHWNAVLLHYLADIHQDDEYERTMALLLQNKELMLQKHRHHADFHCLLDQQQSRLLRGYSLVYRQPSLTDMMIMSKNTNRVSADDDSQQAQVSVNKKQKKTATDDLEPAALSFTGFVAKFVNLSDKPILLHWDGRGGRAENARLVAELPPFESVSTTTTPGQSFSLSPIYDSQHALQRWTVTHDECLLYYEPALLQVSKLPPKQQFMYAAQKLSQSYARDYLIHTQRHYLAQFPRPRPAHYMHEGTYFGQEHVVRTNAGYWNDPDDDEPSSLQLAVKTVSVAPRVFQIDDFLSRDECNMLIEAGISSGMKQSTVVTGDAASAQRDLQTRSSSNAWIPREYSNLTDTIYQRAADLLLIPEELLRHRSEEHMHFATHHSISESLQLLRYKSNQEYTAHVDFTHPRVLNRYQPTRFATLLLYLNDDFEGGNTVFPRAVNAHSHDGITTIPKQGRAVLFYNQLPDGNMDELSQHASKPVLKGTKWLANLWVWDPIID